MVNLGMGIALYYPICIGCVTFVVSSTSIASNASANMRKFNPTSLKQDLDSSLAHVQ